VIMQWNIWSTVDHKNKEWWKMKIITHCQVVLWCGLS
jgi:hypothetical protein